MLGWFLMYSKVIQLHRYILSHILFHYGLLQDTEYINSSLCYMIGPCLPVLNVHKIPFSSLSQNETLKEGWQIQITMTSEPSC